MIVCVCTLYHVLFSTKGRGYELTPNKREALFEFIRGIIEEADSEVYAINGTEDHIHILCSLNRSKPLADLVKEVKTCSSRWIKEGCVFDGFSGWQEGYRAFTHSIMERDALMKHIRDQERIHQRLSFVAERRLLVDGFGTKFGENFLSYCI